MKSFIKTKGQLWVLVITAVCITITAVIFQQSFLRILPLYISLFVVTLQSKVNRYSNLLGAANSVLYAFVYLHYKLYASMASALFVSFPFQIITFIRWNKNSWNKSTVLRKLSCKQRIGIIFVFFALQLVLLGILSLTDANHAFLDSSHFILGVMTSVLTVFAYVEYTWFMILNVSVSTALYVSMVCSGTPEQVPYLVFSVYSLVCAYIGCKKANALYKLQQSEQCEK